MTEMQKETVKLVLMAVIACVLMAFVLHTTYTV